MEPDTAIACTVPLGLGSHQGSTEPSAMMRAALLRVVPFTVLKTPPM